MAMFFRERQTKVTLYECNRHHKKERNLSLDTTSQPPRTPFNPKTLAPRAAQQDDYLPQIGVRFVLGCRNRNLVVKDLTEPLGPLHALVVVPSVGIQADAELEGDVF